MKCVGGRADVVVQMPKAIYVFEIKTNGSAKEVLEQVNSKNYALPYQTDGCRVVIAGVKFSTETKTTEEWEIDS